jgi:transcriptional regulator with XRE-family HTH domain
LKGKGKQTNKWGERLGASLSEKECSLRKASEIAGVSASVLHAWVHESASPGDMLAVKRLCDTLDLDFTWILTGDFSKGREETTLAELYEETTCFEGIARVRIDRLTPRKKEKP